MENRRSFPCWVCFGFGLLRAFDGAPSTGATSRAGPEAWVFGPVSTDSRLTSALDAEPAAGAEKRVIGDPEVCAGRSPREGT